MKSKKQPDAAVYGIDLGKNVFHITGADREGAILGQWKFRCDTLLEFFRRAHAASRRVTGLRTSSSS